MFKNFIKKILNVIYLSQSNKEDQTKHMVDVILTILSLSSVTTSLSYLTLMIAINDIDPKGIILSLASLAILLFIKILFKYNHIKVVIYMLNGFFVSLITFAIAYIFGIYDPAILMIPIFLLASSLISDNITYWATTFVHTTIIWFTLYRIETHLLIPEVAPEVKMGSYIFFTIFFNNKCGIYSTNHHQSSLINKT